MNHRRVVALALVIVIFSVLVPGLALAVESEEDSDDKEVEKKSLKHIFMVTVEGVSSEDLLAAYTPNINGLANLGVQGDAIGVLPPDTRSFLTALFNGVISQYKSEEKLYISLPAVLDSNGRYSVIVDNGKQQMSDEFKGIKRIKPKDSYGYKEADKNIMELAIQYFNQKRPFFTSIILPGTEMAREKFSSSSKEAIIITNKADEQVGRLLKELRSQGIFDSSLIVITGSTSKGTVKKGNLNFEKLMVPVIMAGPGIKSGEKIPPVRIVDISPTIALLTGVSLSPDVDGLVLWNVLDTNQGFSEENLLQKRIKELSQAHLNTTIHGYQLLNDKANIHLEKERINREKGQTEERISKKQQEIDKLEFKLKALKGVGLILIAVAAIGYVLEYIFLRKKFLMF